MKRSYALATIVVIGMTLPFLSVPVVAASIDPTDQASIEQTAVKAYLAKTQADQKSASDHLVATWSAALYNDPGSGVVGNATSDITIVEFFDYNCPFSRAVEPRLAALIKSDSGVKLVLKEFTIEPAASSPIAARAALASIKQGKYEQFHQAMMATRRPLQPSDVFEIAGSAGLDIERLRKDMETSAIYNQVIANFNLARALRIFQTPTFIVGGHIITDPSAQIDFPKLVAAARAK